LESLRSSLFLYFFDKPEDFYAPACDSKCRIVPRQFFGATVPPSIERYLPIVSAGQGLLKRIFGESPF
jgi:hypothetical protein